MSLADALGVSDPETLMQGMIQRAPDSSPDSATDPNVLMDRLIKRTSAPAPQPQKQTPKPFDSDAYGKPPGEGASFDSDQYGSPPDAAPAAPASPAAQQLARAQARDDARKAQAAPQPPMSPEAIAGINATPAAPPPPPQQSGVGYGVPGVDMEQPRPEAAPAPGTPPATARAMSPAEVLAQRQQVANQPMGLGEIAAKAGERGQQDAWNQIAGAFGTWKKDKEEKQPDYVDTLLGKKMIADGGWKSADWWTAHLFNMGGGMSPAIAATFAGIPAPAAFGVTSALQSLVPEYQHGLDQGLTEDQAVKQAWEVSGIDGAVGAVLGFIPGGVEEGATLKQAILKGVRNMGLVAPGAMVAGEKAKAMVRGEPYGLPEAAETAAFGAATGLALSAPHLLGAKGKPSALSDADLQDGMAAAQQAAGGVRGGPPGADAGEEAVRKGEAAAQKARDAAGTFKIDPTASDDDVLRQTGMPDSLFGGMSAADRKTMADEVRRQSAEAPGTPPPGGQGTQGQSEGSSSPPPEPDPTDPNSQSFEQRARDFALKREAARAKQREADAKAANATSYEDRRKGKLAGVAASFGEHDADELKSWSIQKLQDYLSRKDKKASDDEVLKRAGVTPEEAAAMSPEEKAKTADEARGYGVHAGEEAPTEGSREAPIDVKTGDDVARAAAAADQDHTPAQGEANNVPRGHMRWQGLDISIEAPAGGVRRGTTPEGEPWETSHSVPYGYIRGTEGADGMHVDAFMGPNPESPVVYVLDEKDEGTGQFRQHKAFIGFHSPIEAIQAYLGTSTKRPEHIGGMRAVPVDEFKAWLKEGDTKAPISEAMASVKPDVKPAAEASGDAIYNVSPAHHRAAIEGALRNSGMDPSLVDPRDIDRAAKIHAEEGAPADQAFQVAVVRNLVDDGKITKEAVVESVGREAAEAILGNGTKAGDSRAPGKDATADAVGDAHGPKSIHNQVAAKEGDVGSRGSQTGAVQGLARSGQQGKVLGKLSNLETDESAVPRSGERKLPLVRGEGDHGVPGVDAKFSSVSEGHGRAPVQGSHAGSEEEQRGVQRGKLSVGSAARSGQKQVEQRSSDPQRKNANNTGLGDRTEGAGEEASAAQADGLAGRKNTAGAKSEKSPGGHAGQLPGANAVSEGVGTEGGNEGRNDRRPPESGVAGTHGADAADTASGRITEHHGTEATLDPGDRVERGARAQESRPAARGKAAAGQDRLDTGRAEAGPSGRGRAEGAEAAAAEPDTAKAAKSDAGVSASGAAAGRPAAERPAGRKPGAADSEKPAGGKPEPGVRAAEHAAAPDASGAAVEHIPYSPAVKVGDRIFQGTNHGDAAERAALALKTSIDDLKVEDGFVADDGRFLTRAEAYAIADREKTDSVTADSEAGAAAPEEPKGLVERIPGENGTEVLIVKNSDSMTFNAVLRDTDAQKTITAKVKIGTIARAREIAQEMLKGPEAAEPAPVKTEAPAQAASADVTLARALMARLESDGQVTPKVLQDEATKAHGGTLAEGKFDRKDAHDALELAVNMLVKKDPDLHVTHNGSWERPVQQLEKLLARLPTQRVRSEEQVSFQQFSTPPHYALAVAYAAGLRDGDTVLEPSAGTGSIVAAATHPGVKIVANELSPRRAELLRALVGRDGRVTTENAEQIDNILPKDVKPTVVVMNPPFSQTAGRMGDKRVIETGAVHIEQALSRLEPGGRLVAIVGRGMSMEAPRFKSWWNDVAKDNSVRANIGVAGEVYGKYGTNFGTRLLVIDKTPPISGESPVLAEVHSVGDLMRALEPIRDSRPQTAGTSAELKPAEPGRVEVAAGGERISPPAQSEPAEPSRVGAGESGERGVAGPGPGRAGEPGAPDVRVEAGKRPVVAAVEPERAGSAGAGSKPAERPAEGDEFKAGGGEPAERDLQPAGKPSPGIAAGGERLAVEHSAPGKQSAAEITENLYESYEPKRVRMKGAKKHPGPLVESAAMSSVDPPPATYQPALPQKVIDDGRLSLPQLEAVIYAGQAHSKFLPSAEGATKVRKGYFIGDGTGVGKGAEIAGIILDNWQQGRTKAVWVSEKRKLMNDAKRDWSWLDQNDKQIFNIGNVGTGKPVEAKQGVGFITYDTLKGGMSDQEAIARGEFIRRQTVSVNGQAGTVVRTEKGKGGNPGQVTVKLDNGTEVTVLHGEVTPAGKKNAVKTRIDQIVDWFGKDFDGVVAFDEAHNMGNAVATKGARGDKDAAKKALAGMELQKRLPNARVVYVSATGATEVSNLAYAERLGLWGRGTPFADRNKFISEVSSGGIAAMELIARDMKQLGLYTARNLSYDGVQYDRIEHKLDPNQREIYDSLAESWQVVLRNINAALKDTGAAKDGRAKSAAMSAFWGGHQRFFNQIITSLQMPSVIKAVEKDLKEGRQAVLQLTNTNEAAQERAAAKAESAEDIEDLDITPRDMVIQLVEKSFPTQQYEQYVDENGNEKARPVVDSQGNPVQNKKAVAAREALIEKLASIRVPQGPLDLVLDHFGIDNVSEVTGRGRRFVLKEDDKGQKKRMEESRPGSSNQSEIDAFQGGKKKVLVFSEAGGTGASYHADNRSASKDARRSHYLVQAGWRADKAVQGFGRTHRTNQASAPIFHLVQTDLDGQKRFISSIARRLAQLGALTKGQRQAGDQGVFSARDNLESTEAQQALSRFWTDLLTGQVDGVNVDDFEQQTGLSLRERDKDGNVVGSKQDLPEITKFLNRLLSLKIGLQNKVFQEFSERLDDVIEQRRQAGLLDVGLETVRADKITKDSEQTVHTIADGGAETKYVKLTLADKFKPIDFNTIANNTQRPVEFWALSPTGKVHSVSEGPNHTDASSGDIIDQYRIVNPVTGSRLVHQDRFKGRESKWTKIDKPQAKERWQAEIDKAPEYTTRDLHLITGAILPIWDRLKGSPRVVRLNTDAGERLIGRVVPDSQIGATLQALGAEAKGKKIEPGTLFDRLLQGGRAKLANGWTLKRSLVAGEHRIELVGPSSMSEGQQIKADGVFTERIDYATRYFVPVDREEGAKALARLVEHRPVVELGGGGGDDGGLRSGFAETAPQTETPEFKRWFGDSKVVDAQGRPLRAFHGTTKDFDQFDTRPNQPRKNRNNLGDLGSWFAAESKSQANYDEGNAEYIAGSFTEGKDLDHNKEGARVIPAYLSIKNPMEFGDYEELQDAAREAGSAKNLRAELESHGHDGVVVRDSDTDGNVYRDDWVAFHPEQIKSAIGNRGTFDPNHPSMLAEGDGDRGILALGPGHRPIPPSTIPAETISGPFRPRSGLPVAKQAQDYVVTQGRATGNEHLIAIDDKGHVAGTSGGITNFVRMPQHLDDAIKDPKQAIVVHHNHPLNTGLSPMDIAMLGNPGLAAVWAHGHGGNVARMALTPEARARLAKAGSTDDVMRSLFRMVEAIRRSLHSVVLNAIFQNRVSMDGALMVVPHAVGLALHRGGLVDYRANTEVDHIIDELGLEPYIENAARVAAGVMNVPGFPPHVRNDRLAADLRAPGDVGASFEGTAGTPGRDAPQARDDRGGGGVDRAEEAGGPLRLLDSGFAESGPQFSATGGGRGGQPGSGPPSRATGIRSRIAGLLESRLANKIKEGAQDLSHPVKLLQQELEARRDGPLSDGSDFYTKKRLYPGRVGNEVRVFNTDHLDPLVDLMKKNAVSLRQAGDYVYAKHVWERNDFLGGQYPADHPFNKARTDKSIVGASGRSQDWADGVLADAKRLGNAEVMEEIAKRVQAIRDDILSRMENGQLVTPDSAAAWRARYNHYVDLRGFEDAPEEAPSDYREPARFNVRGKEVKQAFGRSSKADNPVVNMIDQAYRTIDRVERNRYLGSVWNALTGMEKNSPGSVSDIVKFDRGTPRKVLDPKTGLVKTVDDSSFAFAPNAVSLKLKGVPHHMVFENRDTAEAVKRMSPDSLGLFQGLLNVQNKLKALWTHYSPDFLFRHFLFRYPIEGTLNSFEQKESGQHSVAKYISEAFPFMGQASRAIFAGNKGQRLGSDAGREMQDYWEEMRKAGGSMVFRNSRDMDMLKEHLQTQLMGLKGKPVASLRERWRRGVEAMDTVTNALDNSLRLAAYASARRQGKTPQQSALIAREATVDFQLKGKWANALGMIWPFATVAIQTGARMSKAVYRSKMMQRVFMGTMLAGFMTAAFNYLVGGDDKDGIPYFEKIPEWDRRLNFIILNPFDRDENGRPTPIKIPMPYNWAFPLAIGHAMGTMAFGKEGIGKALRMIARSGLEVLTPFGQEENMAALLAPELTRPFIYVATNRDYADRPIHNDPTFQKGPNAESGRRNTGDGWKYLASTVNKASGGTGAEKGWLDFYPEDYRHMLDYAVGTQQRLAENIYNSGAAIAKGEAPDPTHVPLERVIRGTNYEGADRALFYEQRKQVLEAHDSAILYQKGRQGDPAAFRAAHAPELRSYEAFQGAEKLITNINKQIDATKANQKISSDEREQRLDQLGKAQLAAMARARQTLDKARQKAAAH